MLFPRTVSPKVCFDQWSFRLSNFSTPLLSNMNSPSFFITPPKLRKQGNTQLLTTEDARKRSDRREEFLAKRRSGSFDSPGQVSSLRNGFGLAREFQDVLSCSVPETHPLSRDTLEKILSTDKAGIREAVREVRMVSSLEENPPLDLLVRMGFIPPLISFLSPGTDREIQFDATWALSNIAGGESSNTLAVVSGGALPPLIKLLDSPDLDLVYQSIWAIGNIVADRGDFRNLALDHSLLSKILPHFENAVSLKVLRNLSWWVVNMCRTRNPSPSLDVIRVLLPKIVWMVNHEDSLIKTDAIWSLAYLSDGPPELSNLLITHVQVLKSIEDIPQSDAENVRFLMGAVRLLGNLFSGTDEQCDAIIKMGFVQKCYPLLELNFRCVQKETLMCLANVAAGSPEQIQAILNVQLLLEKIVRFLQSGHSALLQEAGWIIYNIVQGGTLHQVTALLEAGVILPLCDHLVHRDVNFVKVLLETICYLLNRCPSDFLEPLCASIENCGGLAKIENLVCNENDMLYDLSRTIIDTFFRGEDDELDEFFLTKDDASSEFKMTFLRTPIKRTPDRQRGAQPPTSSGRS